MANPDIYTPQQFRAKLKERPEVKGTTLPPLIGMVQESDLGDDFIQVSLDGCETWTDVPHALIASIAHLRDQRCKDHTHPIVELNFNPITDPLARAAIALLGQAVQKEVRQLSAPMRNNDPERSRRASAAGEPSVTVQRRSGAWCWLLGQDSIDDCLSCLSSEPPANCCCGKAGWHSTFA